MNDSVIWLSLLVFLPALGSLAVMFIPNSKPEALRVFTLIVTGLTFLLSILLFLVPSSGTHFDVSQADMQSSFVKQWIPSFNIYYTMGVDGISLPLVLLTTLISFLAMAASWSITKYVKAYCVLFLILETAMLGVFLSLDFFLVYVFWEVML
jgi:NADH-quinone oxidoreductase subunit M